LPENWNEIISKKQKPREMDVAQKRDLLSETAKITIGTSSVIVGILLVFKSAGA
jgi:hypothetical protein